MKRALVCGAGGFIGHHMVNRLKHEGYYVRGVDLKYPEFEQTRADSFVIGDLTKQTLVESLFYCDRLGQQSGELAIPYDEIYQFAADMGGSEYVFTGENDSDIMWNSCQINLNILKCCEVYKIPKIFYSSSACIYPEHNQLDPNNPNCEESSAYPAAPDSEYGFEKIYSERMYLSFQRNKGLQVRIARYHNIYGPLGTWQGGREKAPAAFCRKVAQAEPGSQIEVFGSGLQTRSFLYIDECIEGTRRLMESDFCGPVNIGSDEMISMNEFAKMIIDISGKNLTIKNIPSNSTGVNGRNSDNRLIKNKLNWEPNYSLKKGIEQTYNWILKQVKN